MARGTRQGPFPKIKQVVLFHSLSLRLCNASLTKFSSWNFVPFATMAYYLLTDWSFSCRCRLDLRSRKELTITWFLHYLSDLMLRCLMASFGERGTSGVGERSAVYGAVGSCSRGKGRIKSVTRRRRRVFPWGFGDNGYAYHNKALEISHWGIATC